MKICDKYEISDFLLEFDYRTVQRGVEYSNIGLVESCKVSFKGSELLIKSEVAGSYLYHQDIYVDLDAGRVDGDCDCPVGYNCKHVVASLFEAFDKPLEVQDSKGNYELWLEKLDEEKSSVNVNVKLDNEHFLIYRLFSEDWGSDVNFHKSKRLKKGGISKGTRLSNENLFYSYKYNYNYLSQEDMNIIPLLKNLANNYRDDVELSGELGAIALKKIIATNRAFYQDNVDTPLRLATQKRELKFKWQDVEGGSRLVSNLSDYDTLISKTEPMFCINSFENVLYEIECDIDKDKLELLLNAPVIPKKDIGRVVQKLIQKMPQESVAVPKDFKVEEFSADIVPYIYIYGIKNGEGMAHCMELKYFYGDYEFDSDSKESYVFLHDKNIKVLRDFSKEAEFRAYIESLGFDYSSNTKAYMSFAKPSMQEAIERWRLFIDEEVDKLRQEGWQIEIDDSFTYEFEYSEEIFADFEESESNNWFSLAFRVNIGGEKLELLPIITPLLDEFDSVDALPEKLNLKLPSGKFLHIASSEVKPILNTIYELFDRESEDKLVIKPYDAHLLNFGENTLWRGAKELQKLAKELKDFKGIEKIEPSSNLNATLREYQKEGISWLNFLHKFKFGGILADDMGLGKTIQTLAFLQILKERGELKKPTLIIMPTSLIGNWKSEIKKFTPNLCYLELYGVDRAELFDELESYDIVLTTYNLTVRDFDKYREKSFEYIILDEAQKIKNPKTKMAKAIKGIKSSCKLALTGTPIENHLGELWSIFDFLMSGFLENEKNFRVLFQNPIEKERSFKKQELLNRKIAPFILRRTKDAVVKELPPKTEIIKKVTLGAKQATLYENIRVGMEKKVRDAIKNKGLNRSHIMILDALLKLRQVCCHPQLLKLKSAQSVTESAKLEMFIELIDTLMAEGKKVLVFSQFTSMLSILEENIKAKKIRYSKLTGATRKRQEAIEKFTKGDANIFLISLKAGGVGLNLVEADTVIHYDPWWNPAVENQATDRAYRIGQDKPVFVYKLVVENSIEEKIVQLQEKKKSIQDGIYTQEKEDKFKGEELLDLLSL